MLGSIERFVHDDVDHEKSLDSVAQEPEWKVVLEGEGSLLMKLKSHPEEEVETRASMAAKRGTALLLCIQ